MKIRLVTDCSANLCENLHLDLAYVPLKIITDECEYVDNAALDVAQMLVELQNYKGRSSTSCPSVSDWLEAFGDADMVLGVSLTSGISGCYNAARLAALDYMDAHPGAQVFILDSLSTGPELPLLLEKYQELVDAGADFRSICKEIVQYHKRTHLIFSLESLENFARNGRVSPVVAKAVGLLGIRIVGRASREGTLEPLHKCRGEKAALQQLLATMRSLGWTGGKVRLSHSFNPRAAEAFAAMLRAEAPDCDLTITQNRGLCCYYAERGGLLVGFES